MTEKAILILSLAFVLVACGGSSRPVGETERCTLAAYRRAAEPQMQQFSRIVKNISLRDSASRRAAKSSLNNLLNEIDEVECKNEFPLKHETLEFSVRHTIDALNYADAGEYVEANQALDRALLNVERFQDWSVDIGS